MQGQWKQISRYYVPSRTPTQVASHAQKHFLRLNGTSKRRSRFATEDALAKAPTRRTSQPEIEEQPQIPAPAAIAVASTASEEALSSATGASDRIGAHMGPSFNQFGGGISFSLPPPADASGVAIGFPMPQPPQLITSAVGGKLPMLPVQPGRLNLNKAHTFSNPTYTNSLHTTQQHPSFSRGESKHRVQQQQVRKRETTTAVRRAHMEQARELRERLHAANDAKYRSTRKTTPQHDSHSGSVCSDTTSTPYTAALDALAGVAAALADDAGY